MFQYVLKNLQDEEMRPVFQYALNLAQDHVQRITEFLQHEQYPVPHGFHDEDVNLNAPRLFLDEFWLKYTHEMCIHGMFYDVSALTTSARQDIRDFFVQCQTTSMELYNNSIDVLLSKGLYHRAPSISKSGYIDFVNDKHYLAGWFGKQRPINGVEMTSIFFNLKKSIITKALLMGFAQTAESPQVRSILTKMTDLKKKHIEDWGRVLTDSDLPVSPSWDGDVTDSTVAPFSDKLMMFHAGLLYSIAMAYYGMGLATAQRKDFTLLFSRIIAEDLDVTGDWIKTMIQNGWMEQPPQTIDHKSLNPV